MAHVPMYQADPHRARSGLSTRRRLGLLLGSLIVLALVGASLGGGFIQPTQAVDQALVMADSNLGRPGLVAALRSALNVAPAYPTAEPSTAPAAELVLAAVPAATAADQPGDAASDASAETEVLTDPLALGYPTASTYAVGHATSQSNWTASAPSVDQEPTRWLADESSPQSESSLRLARSTKPARTNSAPQVDGGDGQDDNRHDSGNIGRGEQDRSIKALLADPDNQGNDDPSGPKGGGDKGPKGAPEDHQARSSNGAGDDNGNDNKGEKKGNDKAPNVVADDHGARNGGENRGSQDLSDDHGARGDGNNRGPQNASDDHGARGGDNDRGGRGNDDKGDKGDKGGKGKK